MKRTLLHSLVAATALACIILAAVPPAARACDACTNRVEIKIPEQPADVLKLLHQHDDALAASVKAKNLRPVSQMVTTMSAYARALPGKAAAEHKLAATNAMTKFRAASRELLRASIFEKQSESAEQARQLHEAVALFDACFDYKPSPTPRGTH